MDSRKAVGLAIAFLFTQGTQSIAADLDENYGYADAAQEVAVPEAKIEFGTGWYVRGDLGATHGFGVTSGDEPYNATLYQQHPGIPAVTSTTTSATGVETITTTSQAVPASYHPIGISQGPGLVAPSISSGSTGAVNYTASLGFGYQFNRWFRADFVADFHQPVKYSRQGQGVPCVTGTYGVGPTPYQYEDLLSTTCTPTLSATLKSYDVLVNGYVDLGTWHSITPYVGAGVGLSFGYAAASSHYIQGNNASYNVTYSDALNGASYNQYWDRSASTQYYNLAFALMGGFAVDIFPHTKLDIGYRYLHLGSVLGTQLNSQEARAGLRYMVDN